MLASLSVCSPSLDALESRNWQRKAISEIGLLAHIRAMSIPGRRSNVPPDQNVTVVKNMGHTSPEYILSPSGFLGRGVRASTLTVGTGDFRKWLFHPNGNQTRRGSPLNLALTPRVRRAAWWGDRMPCRITRFMPPTWRRGVALVLLHSSNEGKRRRWESAPFHRRKNDIQTHSTRAPKVQLRGREHNDLLTTGVS